MANWKDKAGESMRNMADRQEALGAKLRGGANAGTDTLEKLATFQLGLIADGVEATTAQARLLTQPGDPLAFVERQIAYASELGEGATAKAGEFGELLGECASGISELFEAAPKTKSTVRSRKAA
jgi:phasin family protein